MNTCFLRPIFAALTTSILWFPAQAACQSVSAAGHSSRHSILVYLEGGPVNTEYWRGWQGGMGVFYERALTSPRMDRFGKVAGQAGLGGSFGRPPRRDDEETLSQTGDEGTVGAVRLQQIVRTRNYKQTHVEFLGLNYQTPRLPGSLTLEFGARLGVGKKPVQAGVTVETMSQTYLRWTETKTQTTYFDPIYTTCDDGYGEDGTPCSVTYPPPVTTETATEKSGWIGTDSKMVELSPARAEKAWFLGPYLALRVGYAESPWQWRVEYTRLPEPSPAQWTVKLGFVHTLR